MLCVRMQIELRCHLNAGSAGITILAWSRSPFVLKVSELVLACLWIARGSFLSGIMPPQAHNFCASAVHAMGSNISSQLSPLAVAVRAYSTPTRGPWCGSTRVCFHRFCPQCGARFLHRNAHATGPVSGRCERASYVFLRVC